ncbi:MAG: hypothetical protein H7125_17640 [Proteobacteria bacterium]|nr:hypothetical protein [Burkholderiales bacterium]
MKPSLFAIATLATIASLAAAPALADKGGGCHFHGSTPAKRETVSGCATQRKDALVSSGKLDVTWKDVKHDKVEQVEGKKGKEWKVSFKNPVAKDKAKDTLYVFLSLPGNYIAANFTGQ